MSSAAILSHRSMLEGGKPYDIPDFTVEADCKKYENDRATPFYSEDENAERIPCCSHVDYKPSENKLSLYRKMLEEIEQE
jgi:hypothetical protein